ncbi:uncharacterized protein LOC110989302 [Acanthaster planci]|uniref:Uncharacterized protein LOC110989302 n=1 Tax=Acanthaster planci TaxID=133434 RepID=A0A8B7ZUP9_ACAPL|nr:uncharacterized protein LOC110989302 [Acanthaster planci]XP_022109297.1 uncharacterized protein LOC110989302 [Acanthaster planci]
MHMKSRQPAGSKTPTDSKPKWFEDAKNTHKHQAKYLGKILSMKESLAREEQQRQQQAGGLVSRLKNSGSSGMADPGTATSYNQVSSTNPGFPNRGAKTKFREMGKGRSPPDLYPIDIVQGKAMFDKGSNPLQRDKQNKWWRSGSLEERHLIKRSSKDMPKILPPMATIPSVDRRSGYCEKLKSYSATCTGSKVTREEPERDKMIDLKMPVKKSAKAFSHMKGANKTPGKLCKTRPSDRPLRRTQSLDFRCELAPVHPTANMDTDISAQSCQQGRHRSNTGDYARKGSTYVLTKQSSLSELMDKMEVLEGAVGGAADAMEYSDGGCVATATNDEPMIPDDMLNCVPLSTVDRDEHRVSTQSRGGNVRSLLEVSNQSLLELPSSEQHSLLQRRHTLPIINLRPPTPRLTDRDEKTADDQMGRILRKVVCQSVLRKRELSKLCEDIEEFNEINTVLSGHLER